MIAYWILIVLAIGLHEFAHGLVASRFGVPVREVLIGLPPVGPRIATLRGVDVRLGKLPLGFAVGMPDEAFYALGRRQAVAVWLAGVAMNAALAGIYWLAGFHAAGLVSLALAAMNLLPVPPLDGGQALLSALGTPLATRERIARVGNLVVTGVSIAVVVFAWLA